MQAAQPLAVYAINHLDEARKRMQSRKSRRVCWTYPHMIVEFKLISAHQARNWDGSSAGQGNDLNQTILQRMTWVNGQSPRFTNWW